MQTVRARPFSGTTAPCRVPVVAPRTSVVVQVKPTKASDFKDLPGAEIVDKVSQLKKELFITKSLQKNMGFLPNPDKLQQQTQPDPEKVPKAHVNKHLRRQIAQMLTVLRQKEIEAGVSRKESKRYWTQQRAAGGFANL